MVLSLLYGRKYARARVGTVQLDASLSEEHNYRARVTNYPVENGSIISDHIINDPIRLFISGIVSDTPLNLFSIGNRSIDAFNVLLDIYNRKQIISVVTGIRVYSSMVITSLNVPRNLESGQSLTFNIELQRIQLDSSVRLLLDPNNPTAKAPDVIPRDIVADANNYPFIQFDPITSLKDQASSGIDIGIQDLQPIPTNMLPNILQGINIIRAVA